MLTNFFYKYINCKLFSNYVLTLFTQGSLNDSIEMRTLYDEQVIIDFEQKKRVYLKYFWNQLDRRNNFKS